jgi:hypothetical protein
MNHKRTSAKSDILQKYASCSFTCCEELRTVGHDKGETFSGGAFRAVS